SGQGGSRVSGIGGAANRGPPFRPLIGRSGVRARDCGADGHSLTGGTASIIGLGSKEDPSRGRNDTSGQLRGRAVGRIRVGDQLVLGREIVAAAAFVMHAFDIVLLAGGHWNTSCKGRGRCTGRDEFVRALLTGAAATRARDPFHVVAPAGFGRNQL